MGVLVTIFLVGIIALIVWITRIQIQAHLDDVADSKRHMTQVLQLDPRYQAAIEAERRYKLETRKLDIEEYLAKSRLDVSQHGTYLLTEVPNMIHLPPVHKPALLPAAAASEEKAVMPDQPRMDEMYEAVRYNSLDVAFGKTVDGGKIITVNIPKGVHFKLVGGSGFGKSCLAAALLDIATRRNDPDHLRIALLDLEHKTSRLFEDLPHVFEMRQGNRTIRLTAGDADEVARKLAWLRKELDRRATSQIVTPLLLIYVEEMLSLQYEVDAALKEQMLADLAIIALRGRKYGMFLLACTQTDYSTKELKEAQKQFRTRSGFAIDPSAARAAGFVNNDLVKYNFRYAKPGQYLLEQPAFSELMLAPLYDVETKLEEMSNPGMRYSGRVVSGSLAVPGSFPMPETDPEILQFPQGRKQPELDFDKLEFMRGMLRNHRSQSEIITALFSGMRNSDAILEYRKYLAALVDGGLVG